MKFSVAWLQEWLNSPVDPQVLADTFSMSGLEVESLEPAAAEFHGVVVGEIVAEALHPDAKRLHCCQVRVSETQLLSIVCGGVNVRPGLKIAVALDGAQLPGGIEIKETQLRGQLSQGMICSARELGLGEDKEGCILELPANAPIGLDLREYLQLDDQVIDVALTPNRGDCLSIRGMARESAVLLQKSVQHPPISSITALIPDTLKIHIKAPSHCPHYAGRVVRGISLSATTPIWMQERLRRSGVRSIHPVVDVTNYVMLELGQPMHAFDLEKLHGDICVRMAKPGESLALLDGQTITLDADALVIADAEQALALAGVMGGNASAVSATTANLFLESAFFSPIPLSLTARRYGLNSDSSYRYARGVDPELAVKALERATKLLLEIAGGKPGPIVETSDPAYLPQSKTLLLRREQIFRLLGIHLPDEEVIRILKSLGMQDASTQREPSLWEVRVPSYRFDIALEVDLIEELARIHGYARIPAERLSIPMTAPAQSEKEIPLPRLLSALVDRGYHEAITYSFVEAKTQAYLDPARPAIALANPISSEMSVMRTSLWPGLLQAMQYNLNRQMPRVRLFETGLCFLPPADHPEQVLMLGGAISGSAYPEQWGMPTRPADFFDLKGDLEALLALTAQAAHVHWLPCEHPALHPGQSAALYRDQELLGYCGALHPAVSKKLDMPAHVYLFELNLNLIKQTLLTEFKPISKFPGVRRDLAVTLDQNIPIHKIRQFIQKKAGNLLNNVQLFDVYQGQNIEVGQKSIALALIFQAASRTLKDEEIQTVVDQLIQGLETEFHAKLRI